MRQIAPEPKALHALVDKLQYKPDWTFTLEDIDRGQGSEGLTLKILVKSPNSYQPEHNIYVNHYMIVPPAAYDERAWQRWLLDQILLVETHEACEFFQIARERPFAPNHGPGRNPYSVIEQGTQVDAETNYRGEKFGKSAVNVKRRQGR